jgi:hypothetical protein
MARQMAPHPQPLTAETLPEAIQRKSKMVEGQKRFDFLQRALSSATVLKWSDLFRILVQRFPGEAGVLTRPANPFFFSAGRNTEQQSLSQV